jgi:hypothetical protein
MRGGVHLGLVIASCAMASLALAQDLSWREAEAAARAHFEGAGSVELRARRDLRLGPVFWARTTGADGAASGALVFVRPGHVVSARGAEGLLEVLRLDDAVHAPCWTALALFDVLRESQVTVPLPLTPWRTHEVRSLRPQITRHDDVLEWSVACSHGGPPEAPATPQLWIQRATLTLGTDYVMHWTVVDQHVDMHGRVLWQGEPRTP